MNDLPPNGIFGSLDPSNPQTAQLLGAIQGLGAAAAPSRLPVTAGMAFGSLAGGLMAGADQGAKLRQANATTLGSIAANQQALDNMAWGRAWLGQSAPSAADLMAGKYSQLQTSMPNPGAGLNAPGSLAPLSATPPTQPIAPNLGAKFASVENPSGDPTAKNPLSSATGDGQFIKGTWLDLIKNTRPDLAAGKSDDEILALRNDSKLSQEMTARYAAQNADVLKGAGFPASATNLFMAHMLGPQGAVKTLAADPTTSMSSLVSPAALKANPILQDKTAGDMAAWAHSKMAEGFSQTATDATPLGGGQMPLQGQQAGAAGGGMPTFGQLMPSVMGMSYFGMKPPPALAGALVASMMPPGPLQQLALMGMYKQAGLDPVQNLRQGGGIAQLGQDLRYHLGMQLPRLAEGQQLEETPQGYTSTLIPGTTQAISQTAAAESGGKAAGALPYVGPTAAAHAGGEAQFEPMTVVDPATGMKHTVPRSVLGAPPGAAGAGTPGLVSGLGPGQETALETRGKEEQTQRQEVIDQGNAAQQQQAALQNMKNDSGNFVQGPFSAHAQEAARYLRLINPAYDQQVASYEDFVKNAGGLLRQAVHDVSSRAAVQEYKLIGDTLPSPDISPQGLGRVANELMGLNDYRTIKAQAQSAWEQQHGGIGNVSGFETDFQNKVTPYALIVARMAPADRQAMVAKLQQSKEGQALVGKIGTQLNYLKSSGLDTAIQ